MQLQYYWHLQHSLMLPATPMPVPLLIPWSSAAKLVGNRMKLSAGKPPSQRLHEPPQLGLPATQFPLHTAADAPHTFMCPQLVMATYASLSTVCLVPLQMSGCWSCVLHLALASTCAACAAAVLTDLVQVPIKYRQCWAQ